jgi:CBS domain-containing protein
MNRVEEGLHEGVMGVVATLLIKDVMTRDVKIVDPDSSVAEVAAAMNRFGVGSIIIVEGGEPVGVVSERDILSRVVEPCLSPEATTARQIMSSPVVSIPESATLGEAVRLMAERQVRKVPVVREGRLVGIVTYTDIVSEALAMVSLLGELV